MIEYYKTIITTLDKQ